MKKFMSGFLTAVWLVMVFDLAYAATFTHSVTAKPAPPVIKIIDENGVPAAAFISNKKGSGGMLVPFGELIVTPILEKEQAATDINLQLTVAYEEIKSKKLSELSDAFQDYLKINSPDLTEEDLVIRDCFDATVRGTYKDYLDVEGNRITIRFDVGIEEDAFFMVMINTGILEGEQWEIIAAEDIVHHPDGSISITFDHLCPVLFITDVSQVAIDPDGPESPKTGDALYGKNFGLGIFAAVMIGAGIIIVAKKRRNVAGKTR